MAAFGAKQADRFHALEPRVREISESIDPFFTLSSLVQFALMDTPERVGDDAFLHERNTLNQSHLEYLQALLLRRPLAERHQDGDIITELIDLIPNLFTAFQQMRLGIVAADDSASTAAARNLVPLQELLRGHTLGVRNWAYFSSAIRVARGVYAPSDDLAEGIFGFRLTHILDLVEYLNRRITERVNEFRARIATLGKARSVDELVELICTTFSVSESPEELRRIFVGAKGSLKRGRLMAANGLQSHLAQAFFFDLEEIAIALKCESECASLLLHCLSIAPGDLADKDPTTFLLDNPVWLQPLIAAGGGRFFCAIPQSILCFIHPIVDGLAQSDPALRSAIKTSRARYLEQQVHRLFERAFPNAMLTRGYKWTEGDRRYESDLIVRFDTSLLLIEAKSGAITWSALRGAPDRLKKHVKELIIEPSVQSLRLENHLRKLIERGETNDGDVPTDLAGVAHVCRLSVTLEDFATVQSNLHLLADIFNVEDVAPCVLLTDLEVVFDILEQPYERIDYLSRRIEVQRRFRNQGDEMDLLGFYLDTGLNLDEAQSSSLAVLVGFGERFDQYYCRKDAGLLTAKPKAKRTAWLQRICDRLEARAPQGWTDITGSLLRLTIRQQEDIERELRSAASRLLADIPLEVGRDLLVCTPAEPNSYSLVFLVHHQCTREVRRDRLEAAANQAFVKAHIRQCAALALPAVDPELNYDAAALFYPASPETSYMP